MPSVVPVTGASSSQTRSPPLGTGLLIIRVWAEPEHPTSLRARIIRSTRAGTDQGSEPKETSTASATVEEALGVVRAWLEEFVAR